MNNRKMSLGQDHSMTPIHDPSTVNLNIPTNFSAANLNSNQQASRDNKSDSIDDSKILVAIRIRPLIQKEIVHGELDIIRNEDNLLIVLDRVEVEHEQENKKITDILHRSKEQRYAFDKIFREHSQEQIYQETCKNLIKQVLDGYNACVFAYGPTGTGKTYTMIGNNEIPGLNVLTIRDIFDSIKRTPDREFTVHISYVEIYNETIRDLLVPSSSYLELRDDPIKGVQIAGVTELKVENTEQIMSLIIAGNRRRTTEATNANQTSSRSHAVFQIVVTSCPKTRNIEIERTQGKLSLIDLAGSERGTVTENRGIRLREGAKINRSLLALANCINALGDKSKKGFFVPYRDSKLTRLLKDSLGGNSRTVMIANISPAGSQIEETLNTLKYASRAKNIKTKTTSNKKLVSLHVAEYKNIINDLRHEIEQLKSRVSDGIPFNPTPINFDSNLLNAQIQCQCVCGRLEDEVEMKKIQSELFENFQERIQLRRALMELEEQNALNYLEIKRKQAEIIIWKKKDMLESQSNFYKNDGDGTNRAEDSNSSDNANFPDNDKRPLSGVPNEIKQEYKNIQTLRMSTDKNTFKREMMQIQLAENIRMAKQIRDSIPLRVKHQDKRNYLETIIGNHVLELQNIELEIHLQIQEKTMNDLKNIIQAQKKIIDEHQLDNNIKITWENEDVLEDEEPHSEGDEMNIDDIVYDDEDEQDAAEEDDEVDFEALEYKDILEKGNVNAYRNANTPSNSKHASHIRIRRRGRSPNNRSLTEHSGEQSNRSRAVSKNKKQVIGFEQNKGVLENNFLADEKKSHKEALIPVENELSGSNRSPRIGPTPNKLIENHPHFNSYLANASNNSHKNDTSVLSNVNAPSKDTNLQQPPRIAKKTPSSGNNPVPGGNFLPPLNPQGGPASIGISTKSGQNTTGSNSKLAPITNINSLKEQKSDNGARAKSTLVAINIYSKKKKV